MDAQRTDAGSFQTGGRRAATDWSRSLRGLHAEMVEAASAENGLELVAELAAEAVAGSVAIVAPRLGGPWLAPAGHLPEAELERLVGEVMARVADPRVAASASLLKEAPIVIAGEVVGIVALLRPPAGSTVAGDGGDGGSALGELRTDGVTGVDDATVAPHATKVIHLAAMAALTGVVVAEARAQAGATLEPSARSSAASTSEAHRGGGTYRLLLRMMASHPQEVQMLYESTVAALVGYDEQYGSDLVRTLQTYLANNCKMSSTAAALFAHRHTIAYRLERIRELTGLDPSDSEDRERLGLGLKAYRMFHRQLRR
jgi:hypothetical protein